MVRMIAALLMAALGASGAQAQERATPLAKTWTFPSDAEIRRILVQRIDEQHQGVGMVVGIVDATAAGSSAMGSSTRTIRACPTAERFSRSAR